MRSCRVVSLLALALLSTLDAGASREVDEEKLMENLGMWQQLQRMVNAELKTTQPDTFVNPFNDTGFLSIDKSDGSAVILSAKNIVPDLSTMSLLLDTARNSSAVDLCATYFPPPDGYEREAVPLITIAVMTNITYPRTAGKPDKYLPYLCALKRQTALMVILDISGSLAYPPLGDVCASMQLIRQALHSARFLVTLFRESTMKRKSGLCRPIVWGNLSPFLQIRRDIEHEAKETLLFLGSNGGSINFGVDDDIHWLGPYNKRSNLMKHKDNAMKRQRLLSHLYAVFDNTCQLAFRSRRLGENMMTGPRFSVPNVGHMKDRWQSKRKDLSKYIEKEGQDLSTINILQIIPVLLFAGTITMFIACNPQYIANDYERIVEMVEEEPPFEGKNTSKDEKRLGVLETIKKVVSDPMNVSHGKRVKKKKSTDKTTEQSQTVAEVTAEGDATITCHATEKKDDKKSKKKASKGGATSTSKKKLPKQQEKTSDQEMTADGTMGTTAGTEVTAGNLTGPSKETL